MPISVTRLSSVRLASSLFESSFSSRPAVAASAPGRVNLIGEHTDYNGGPVLPLAVERRTAVLAAREDGWFFVSDLDRVVRGAEIEAPLRRDWTDYVVGVVRGEGAESARRTSAHPGAARRRGLPRGARSGGCRVRADGSDHRRARGARHGAPLRDRGRRHPAGAVHGPGVDRGDRRDARAG